ncbi:MAG: fumarylacetoacetate hydrolase family protein [SAR324 cluster bacterium]|nr:fumarylacetoacetate hydrolase family protein [SAR324 cluster bacterium]
MKLIRFGNLGQEKPGLILEDKQWIDVSAAVADYDESFFENDGLSRLKAWLANNAKTAPRVDKSVRLGAPIYKPGKIVCIGANYRDHIEETGAEIPEEPVIFFKSPTALTGPNDNLIIPKNSVKTDWEVELLVVIEKRASYVKESDALDYVAGYALHNDYSERAFQIERSGQWVKGKSCDTFAPVGPFIATKDEIKDVNNLKMWLKVNGVTKQNGTTANMIFNVPFIVSYISEFMTLLPGDIISTGTPAGVGLGLKPPEYLKPGDIVELGIEGLGESAQNAVAYSG